MRLDRALCARQMLAQKFQQSPFRLKPLIFSIYVHAYQSKTVQQKNYQNRPLFHPYHPDVSLIKKGNLRAVVEWKRPVMWNIWKLFEQCELYYYYYPNTTDNDANQKSDFHTPPPKCALPRMLFTILFFLIVYLSKNQNLKVCYSTIIRNIQVLYDWIRDTIVFKLNVCECG